MAFESDVYSYQRRDGGFTGTCLKGGILSHYSRLSSSLYGVESIHTDVIFNEIEAPFNQDVYVLMEALTMYGK
jgi:hypothetical protein